MTISIPGGATGFFADPNNIDPIAIGDQFNSIFVTGSGGTNIQPKVFASTFTSDGQAAAPRYGFANNVDINVNNATRYNDIGRGLWDAASTQRETQLNVAGTLRNLYFEINNNTRTTDVTMSNTKNTANGAISVVIPAGATGVFEETSTTESYADNDTVGVRYTSGTGGGGVVNSTAGFCFEYATDSGVWQFVVAGGPGGWTQGGTQYVMLGGDLGTGTGLNSDVEMRILAGLRMYVRNIGCAVEANAVLGSTTVTLRKNGASSTHSVSVPFATTGYFETTGTANELIEASDELNHEILIGAGGTSITFNGVTLLAEATRSLAKRRRALPAAVTAR